MATVSVKRSIVFFKYLLQPIRSNTQIWIVTRHQNGISGLILQTSFRRENRSWWHRKMSRAIFSGYSRRVSMIVYSSRGIILYAAISRKVVGKSARDKPEWYCGWFWIHCSSKKFERMAREAMDICLRVLKESNIRMFNSYIVRNSVLMISHITFRDCRVHIFTDNISRNRCMPSAWEQSNLAKSFLKLWFLKGTVQFKQALRTIHVPISSVGEVK